MNGITTSPSGAELLIDTKIYGIDAIKKTAYKFADRLSVIIKPHESSGIALIFNFKPEENRDAVLHDFCNELLDQDLREILKRETLPVRNLIMAHAFSRTSLASQE